MGIFDELMNIFDEMFFYGLSHQYGYIDLGAAVNCGMQHQLASQQMLAAQMAKREEIPLINVEIKEKPLIEADAKGKSRSFDWYHC